MSFHIKAALACAAFIVLVASCGGGSAIERDSSAKGIITCKPSSGGTGKAGTHSVIYFYDDGSSSSAGPIVKFEWNFGNGWEDCTQTGGLCPHFYDLPGTYVAHLRVTDSTGKKGQEKIKIVIEQGFDAEPVFMVWGVDEGDEFEQGSGGRYRYHTWRWRTLSYDPEHPEIRESPTLAVSTTPPGDPDFDLLRVILSSGDPDFDFCGIDTDGDGDGDDLDGDGVDDDPSFERNNAYWPHMHQLSGRCQVIKSNPDVYVWKIKTIGVNGEGKKEYTGHVTLLK
ncbi:MAG: PKD domain-containing protein [bacterium]|nr:PKD domain-containing protein [bacterium]